MVDAAHIAGLIAGGAHPSPVPYADVVTTTTHKTLRGPRAGVIMCREQYATAIDKAVFPGLQGGPLMHVVAAKAVAFQEALQPEFRDYAAADRGATRRALADALAAEGFRIVSGGTDNHLMLVDLRPFGVTGKVAQEALDRAGITCNKNAIPNDPEKPFVTSGLRLGTAAVTTAGMREPEMRADLVADRAGAAQGRRRAHRGEPSVAPSRPTGLRRRSLRARPSVALCAEPAVSPPGELSQVASGDFEARYARVPDRRRGGRDRHLPADVRRCGGSRRASARWRCPGRAASTRSPTPSLGGAAMFVGFLVAMAVASQLDQFHEMFADNTEPLGLLLAAAVMFVVGAIDDLREVSPPAKIAGQVLSGSILSLLGVTMLYFRVPFACYEYVVLSPDLAPLVTVLTVVVLANAINLIDGLDGLACGIVIIAGAAMFLYADRLFKAGLLEGSNMAPLVAAITVGICVGLPAPQLQPGADLHGRRRRHVPRAAAGDHDHHRGRAHRRPVQRPDLLLLRAAGHPARDPRRADLRHRVLVPPPRRATPVVRPGRPRAPAPPAHAHGPRPPPGGRHPLAVDRAALGRGAAAHLHRTGATRSCRWRWSRSACSSTSTSIPGSAARRARTPADDGPPTPATGEVVELDAPPAAPRERVLEQSRPAGRRLRFDDLPEASD